MQRLFADRFDEMFEILEQSFPADERRPREQQLKLFEIPEYKVFFEGEEEKIMGFMALWEFEDFVYIGEGEPARKCSDRSCRLLTSRSVLRLSRPKPKSHVGG